MQAPKNNLDDVLRRKAPSSVAPTSHRLIPALKATKFKPAPSSNASYSSNSAVRKVISSSLPSFSTPGFGKHRSAVSDETPQQLEVICISSDSTPSSLPRRVKRTSSDLSVVSDPSPQLLKRSRRDDFSEKENVFRPALKRPSRNKEKTKASPRVRLFSHEDILGKNVPVEHNPWTQLDQDYPLPPRSTTSTVLPHNVADQDCDLISVDTDTLNSFLVNNLELAGSITERELAHHRNPTMKSDIVILERIRASVAVRIDSIKKILASRERSRNDITPSLLAPRPPAGVLSSTLEVLDHHETLSSRAAVASTSQELEAVLETSNGRLQNVNARYKLMADNTSDQDVDVDEAMPVSEADYWEGMEDVTMDDAYSDTLDFIKGTPGPSSSKDIPPSNPTSSPCHNEVMRQLREVFGLQHFRHNQLEVITEALSGRDVFVLMPTGGGKSLCYQLPAVCAGGKSTGVTVVVSPLLALMKDQVHALQEKSVDVFLWNSEASWDEAMQRMRVGPKPSLMYITPEKLKESNIAQNVLSELYNKRQLARFVVDEAHCISTWGQDFREAYRDLDQLRTRYPTVPIMALTATARKNTVADIIKRLGLRDCAFFTQSFNRPNLRYIVEPKGKNWEGSMMDFIASYHPNKSGVIYCLGRDKCEEVAKKLKNRGFNAEYFHAGMSLADKDWTLAEWRSGRIHIIVATIAFGMGIDKADVRFVIHYTLPKSLDGYYQETGRAGRDGEPADCILYFQFKDFMSIKNMIERPDRDNIQATPESIARQTAAARAVVDYCLNISDCRRIQLLHYFDEKFEEKSCGRGCDNCAHSVPLITRNVSTEARAVVELVRSFQTKKECVTLIQCRDILRGAKTVAVKSKQYDKLQCYGVGQDMPSELLEQMIRRLCFDDVLQENPVIQPSGYHTDYVVLGPSAENFLYSNKLTEIQWRPKAGKAGKTKQTTVPKTSRPSRKQRVLPVVDEPIELYEDDPPLVVEPGNDDIKCEVDIPRKICKSYKVANRTISTESTRRVDRIGYQDITINDPTNIYQQMLDLREEIAAREGVSAEDVLGDFTLQLLSLVCPQDYVAFKSTMKEGLQEEQPMSDIKYIKYVDEQYNKYGADFMNLCIEHKFNAKPSVFPEGDLTKFNHHDKQLATTSTNVRKSKFKPPRS